MKGKVVNQWDNIVSIEIKEQYEFKPFEAVELEPTATNYMDDLRGLYWSMLSFIIDNDIQHKIPGNWFMPDEPKKKALEKLYTLTRFQVGWVQIGYDRAGMETIQAKSTSNQKISQRQFSDLYANTYEWLQQYMTLEQIDQYQKQHGAAREKLNKI